LKQKQGDMRLQVAGRYCLIFVHIGEFPQEIAARTRQPGIAL
jgi:hypothetical protein